MVVNSYNYNDWINKAKNDLLAAEAILKYYEDPPADAICYHCHQTVEKVLKACLLYHKDTLPCVHDLVGLLNLCIKHNKKLKILKEKAEILNKYYIEAKYPLDNPIIYSKNEARQAKKLAGDIFAEIVNMIRK